MIEYMKGILVESTPLKTVVEVGGIGYKILTPVSSYSKLPAVGEPVCLFISLVIREDSHKYFGFLTSGERDLFETLIEISGIGPKTGLALLGHLDAADLQIAISQSDVTSICKVPGIGKKTAERLIIEMRDRIQKNSLPTPVLSSSKSEPSMAADALRALINLGYQPLQAQKAVKAVLENEESQDLGKLITLSLRKL